MALYYRASSYGPRYCDPCGTYVRLLTEDRVTEGPTLAEAENAAQELAAELPIYCDRECGDCEYCCPDIVVWGEMTYTAKDLFSPAELKEHRRALRRCEVVFLDR
jgi:hypothetical protein